MIGETIPKEHYMVMLVELLVGYYLVQLSLKYYTRGNSQLDFALPKKLFYLVGFIFVDNCDLAQSGTNPIDVLEFMQSLINGWGVSYGSSR